MGVFLIIPVWKMNRSTFWRKKIHRNVHVAGNQQIGTHKFKIRNVSPSHQETHLSPVKKQDVEQFTI